jgi:ABC-type sugar transport system ATPase subunit
MPKVYLDNLTVGYGNRPPILEHISTSFTSQDKEGKVIAIVGRSGSGKSSLLKVILGLDRPKAGSIRTEPANAQFAFLPQEPIVLEHLSIRENVYYFERIGATAKRVKRSDVEQLSSSLSMREIIDSSQDIGQLSGGEKQRVALLRALSVEPDILCLDEPCSGLDVNVKREFLIGLRTTVQSRGILTLYVTHHADEALMIADEMFFIEREDTSPGRLWVGSVPSLVKEPPVIAVRRFFGGVTLNTLRCTIVAGSIQLRGCRGTLGQLPDSGSIDDCFITFMPENLVLSDLGVPIRIMGTSDWFTFFGIVEERFGVTLIGPGAGRRASAVRLRGEVDMFELEGGWIRSVVVNGAI